MAREMKDSGIEWIGCIPSSWDTRRVKNGFIRKNEKAMVEDPVVLSLARSGVRIRNMDNAEGQFAESYFNYNPVEPGDLLLNPMDLYSGANCSISKVSGVISPAYMNLRAKENYCPEYYDYYFKTQYWAMAMFAHGKGVSFDNRWTINAEDLFRYFIPYPNYDEQVRIASFLDRRCAEIDSVIADTRRTIEEYKVLKQSIITEAVTKGVRGKRPMKDSGIEWIEKIPSTWHECRIKNAIFPREKSINETDEIITCFRDGEVTLRKNRREDGFTVSFTEHGYHGVDVGDLVIHGMDAFAGAIGCSDSRGKTTPVVHVCDTVGNNRYFMYYLRSLAYGNILMDLSNGVRIRSSDFRNFTKLGAFGAIVPPIDEQNEIVAYVDEKTSKIDTLITQKTNLLSELESYKKSLIYEYVTGKKEVPAVKQEILTVNPIFLKALLYAKAQEMLGKNCRGRIQIQKILFMIECMYDTRIGSQFVRQKFGPLDVELDKVEAFLKEQKWLKVIHRSTTSYQKMENHKAYHEAYEKHFGQMNQEIERLIHYFENMRSSQAERFATLMAAWNDFLLDGNATPTDDELIREVRTNWHSHKENFKLETWQDTLQKMRAQHFEPHGYVSHTTMPE